MALPAPIIPHEVEATKWGGHEGQRWAAAPDSPADSAPSASERLLLDSVHRLRRSAEPRQFTVLHFSRMPPPGPRAHHRRVARALLQDVAHGFEGQVFVMRNGDLALLCRPGREGTSLRSRGHEAGGPADLPATLALLMQMDAPDPRRLVSAWSLHDDIAAILAYVNASLAGPGLAAAAPEDGFGDTDEVAALARQIEAEASTDLLHRQTGVLLQADGQEPIRPIYCEITFSLAALAQRAGLAGQRALRDPFLLPHLAEKMDQRLLRMLVEGQNLPAPLDILPNQQRRAGAPAAARPLPHINLTVRGASSTAFGSVIASARRQAVALGVEFSLLDACADLDRFQHTRQRLQAAGVRVVIDRIAARALPFLRLACLQADLFKLDWSPQLAALDAPAAAALAGALAPLDSSRLVLQGADTEAALIWGLGRGIKRFQGRHVDAMLAAERMLGCPQANGYEGGHAKLHAGGCSLGQCSERASATGDAGRIGCRNLPLLDAGTRPRVRHAAA